MQLLHNYYKIRIKHQKVMLLTSSCEESHSDDAGTGVVFEARLAFLMIVGRNSGEIAK